MCGGRVQGKKKVARKKWQWRLGIVGLLGPGLGHSSHMGRKKKRIYSYLFIYVKSDMGECGQGLQCSLKHGTSEIVLFPVYHL